MDLDVEFHRALERLLSQDLAEASAEFAEIDRRLAAEGDGRGPRHVNLVVGCLAHRMKLTTAAATAHADAGASGSSRIARKEARPDLERRLRTHLSDLKRASRLQQLDLFEVSQRNTITQGLDRLGEDLDATLRAFVGLKPASSHGA